jgi:hypothetical protein
MRLKQQGCMVNVKADLHYIKVSVLKVCSFDKIIDSILLSFQLKCCSNIDSIDYLGLTNSFD